MTGTSDEPLRVLRQIVAGLLTGLSALLLIALLSYLPEQVTGVGTVRGNLCGSVGARLAHHLVGAWGVAAFLAPLLCGLMAWSLWREGTRANLWLRLTGAVLLLPVSAGLAHLLPADGIALHLMRRWDQVHLSGIGGNTGWFLAATDGSGGLLRGPLATAGSLIVLLGAAIACVLLMQLRLRPALAGIARGLSSARRPAIRPTPESDPQPGRTAPDDRPAPPPAAQRAATPTPLRPDPREAVAAAAPRNETASSIEQVSHRITRDSTTSLDANDLVARIRARRKALEEATRGGTDADVELEEPSPTGAPAASPALAASEARPSAPSATVADASTTLPPPVVPAAEPGPVIATPAPKPAKARPKPAKRAPVPAGAYALPPIDLLGDSPESRTEEHHAETLETSREIETLFAEFGINIKIVAATRGPTITMYELELQDAGMRVNKVAGFEKELSLRLGTDGIRIVAPLPNKKTIGIEVPNRLKMAVVMRDLVDDTDPERMALPVIIGRDVIGQPMVGDLAKMPHLLIAGATGTGKSVCLNAIIASILLFKSPDECRFIMVDPKMVELAGYDGIPHLLTPPITDMSKAHAALEWTCKTMDERFYALRMTGCRDIHAFNKLSREDIEKRLAQKGKTMEEIPGFPDKMPFLVVVVDEYADLMMVNKDVEKSLVRLTAKARACGIHVVLATQRPSADVVTGLIKSNLPCRICCRVADKNNSRVVLDAGGAENLLGRGDMLYLAPGTANLIRGQGVWVRDHELDAIIDHAREQGEPEYDDSITAPGAISGAGGSSDGAGDEWQRDYQFHVAVWNMFKSGKTGADFLRRRLQVGYNKATKYVEWLEDLGFLSEAKGSRPREFLRSWDDWIDELKINEVTWDPDDEAYSNPFD